MFSISHGLGVLADTEVKLRNSSLLDFVSFNSLLLARLGDWQSLGCAGQLFAMVASVQRAKPHVVFNRQRTETGAHDVLAAGGPSTTSTSLTSAMGPRMLQCVNR